MTKIDEQQKKISNKDIDWAKHYDFYEVEFRDRYRTVSKPQNESHYQMLKSKGLNFLRKENAFCEIGFSIGLTLRYALNHFDKVYGLDISPKNTELTEKELKSEGYSNFELYTSDLMVFDERFEKKFDVISFVHGLEHFTADDYPLIFKNIKKYLKPNGIFTGALPFNNGFNYRMCPNCNHVFEIDGHVSTHNIKSLKKLFEENDFEIIHLDNFNLKYALSYGNTPKKLYRFIYYGLFGKQSFGQLEYIVRPKY
jgi:cyclopropane fatty-acyl-phospholipid synthase-like methyltransferase